MATDTVSRHGAYLCVRVADGARSPAAALPAEALAARLALANEFAYAHQRLQQNGTDMPNAFLLPMKKTAAWWQKDWMERI